MDSTTSFFLFFKIFSWAVNAEKKGLPISYDGKTMTDTLLMMSDQLLQNNLDKFRKYSCEIVQLDLFHPEAKEDSFFFAFFISLMIIVCSW